MVKTPYKTLGSFKINYVFIKISNYDPKQFKIHCFKFVLIRKGL